MESLVPALATFLGFHSSSGCALLKIFEHIHATGPFAALSEFPDTLKDFLWYKIVRDTDTFLLFCSEKQDGITAETACFLGCDGASGESSNSRGEPAEDIEWHSVRDRRGKCKTGQTVSNQPKTVDTFGAQQVFLVRGQARTTLERCVAQSKGVLIGLRKKLRHVTIGIRSDCLNRCTGNVVDFTLVRSCARARVVVCYIERMRFYPS